MKVHLVDGTYELFRHYYGAPPSTDADGHERGAVIGVIASMLGLLEHEATHLGVATDHVVESFRNDLWPGYKTGEGIDPTLWAQFEPLEDALRALGVVVWATVEVEADDAIAAAAQKAADDPGVEQVFVASPDKDLAQCVVGDRVVQLDRRSQTVRDAAGVREKFGVDPASIPDYLALVGDSADGFPGLPGWGAKSASTVLGRYGTLEAVPEDPDAWEVKVRGAKKLSATLREGWDDALLFRTLATLRRDVEVFDTVDDLRWMGPTDAFAPLAESWRRPDLAARATRLSGGSLPL